MSRRWPRAPSGPDPASDVGPEAWRPTRALLRALVVAASSIALGVAFGSPAAVVLGAPFAVLAGAGLWSRPRTRPSLRSVLDHAVVHEGQGTVSRLTGTGLGEIEFVTRAVDQSAHVALRPASGVVGAVLSGDPAARAATLPPVAVSPRRWGRRPMGAEQVAAFSAWAGFRQGPRQTSVSELMALPVAPGFDDRGEAPTPTGVVGAHRSLREGSGVEFSGVRPFRSGDRLRRIDWRTSQRTGRLQAIATRAELDTAVLLVLDAYAEHGRSGGLDGAASSLDLGVRATAALAEHFVRIGDRVGLHVLGDLAGPGLGPAAGRRHLRRIHVALARLRGAGGRRGREGDVVPRPRCAPGTLAIVVSAMLDVRAVRVTADLAGRGIPVLVVDTLPPAVAGQLAATLPEVDPLLVDLGWRLRSLERAALLERLAASGVPVVAWRGPGTLDTVLRRMARRGRVPTAAGGRAALIGRSAP